MKKIKNSFFNFLRTFNYKPTRQYNIKCSYNSYYKNEEFIKMITIKTKYIDEVKTRRNRCAGVRYTFEDRIERAIKRNLGVED